MLFYKRISFRIWLYFSLALSIVFGGVTWYYSSQQRMLITESRGRELKEFCRTIAIGVEISLDLQNFNKLQKAVDNFKERGKEFDFLLLSQISEGQSEQLFTYVSSDTLFDIANLDSSLYLIRYQPYSSPLLSGRVICGMAKNKVERQVRALNRPVLITLFLVFLLSFVLFYFLARRLSMPVSRAIVNAHLLGQNKFDEYRFPAVRRDDEIGLMDDALLSLRGSLMDQRQANERLINNLEEEVAMRTASLNEAFEKLSEAQSIARLAAFTWNPEETYWSVSSNMSEILAMKDSEPLTFDTFCKKVDPSFLKQFEDIFVRAKISRVQESIRLLTESGGVVWLRIITVLNLDEGEAYFSGSVQDITGEKLAEEELERLSLLATNTTNLVIFTDVFESITWVNDSVLALTGYNREELYGKTPKIFQTEKTAEVEIHRIHEAIHSVKPVKAEVLNRGKHGNEYWLELYIQPLFNRQGVHTGFMAIEIDITERKITEERLRKYVTEIEDKQAIINSINANLEKLVAEKTRDLELSLERLRDSQDELVRREKMVTLGMLVAGIAHEVNTPLGAIKASSENLQSIMKEEILAKLPGLNPNELRLVFEICEKSESFPQRSLIKERETVRVLRDLLEVKHGIKDAGFLARYLAQLRFEHTDDLPVLFFSQHVEGMRAVLGISASISALGVSLSTIQTAVMRASKIIRALNVYSHGAESSPEAPFDLRDSLNAVADLLSNKMKQGAVFLNEIPPGTIIKGQEDGLSQVWTNLMNNALQASGNKCTIKAYCASTENGMMKINVENDGPQIPPEILGRIFDEFFTTKKRGEGTGLGLSIVSRIIDRHGGKISCKSSPSATVFEVLLPREGIGQRV